MNLERLSFIREDKDMKQSELATIIDVNQSTISRWEKSSEIPSLVKLNKIANYFNISLDYLLHLSDKKTAIKKTNLNKKEIGKRLKHFRKENDITQIELAEFLNTTHSTIAGYESGKTMILTSFAYQICKKYKISLDWLCGKK